MNAVIYCRYSPRPGNESESNVVQEHACHAYATSQGYQVAEIFHDEAMSGATANRPGLQKALDAVCQNRGSVFLVYSISRAFRSVLDCCIAVERLEQAGCTFVSVKERFDTLTATGKAFLRIMAVIAQLEREQIAERTSDAMRFKQDNGTKVSDQCPYGFRPKVGGKMRPCRKCKGQGCDTCDAKGELPAELEPHPDEQVAVENIIQMHTRDGLPPKAIARALNDAGVRPRGKKWYAVTISAILKRAKVLEAVEVMNSLRKREKEKQAEPKKERQPFDPAKWSKTPVARKDHTCSLCDEGIVFGQKYLTYAEKPRKTLKVCPTCIHADERFEQWREAVPA